MKDEVERKKRKMYFMFYAACSRSKWKCVCVEPKQNEWKNERDRPAWNKIYLHWKLLW